MILNQNPILRRVSKVAPMLSIILFIFQVISYTGLIATWIQSIILVWTAPTEGNWPMILVQILCILQYLDPICTTLLWTGSKIYNTFLSEKIPSRIYFFYFTLHVINLCKKNVTNLYIITGSSLKWTKRRELFLLGWVKRRNSDVWKHWTYIQETPCQVCKILSKVNTSSLPNK